MSAAVTRGRGRAFRPAALLGAVVVATAALTVLVPAPDARAAGRVSVSSDLGSATASLDGATTVTLAGSGFQSVQGGFGGVYVLFGWVSDPGGGGWAPSNGGATGATYVYVPDAESGANAGYSRFIAFPGSSTAGEAHGEIAADGTWSTTMVIPGPTFTGLDRDNAPTPVDCREVTCGIITIGAHGVKNATNETFTPVTFASPGAVRPRP
ncbi:hypothetical protein C8046_06085 [Serinibacter arcticus]|uniref:Uncharacterized protein n=1 Tax=Serinibacter arcticus TaxID=1655435 RepID=A0A2U1ZTI6_9MICO|nr:hypothetical protein [Serinibacter arcticus]PWD50297.1 hypothetical protein C8046_06085 [Serinibacter arcticus]